LCICFMICPSVSCCSSHVFDLCCCYMDRNSAVGMLLAGLSCWHHAFILAIVVPAILQSVLVSFGCALSLLVKVCVKPAHFDCRGHFCLQLLVIRFNFLFTSPLPKLFSASLVPSFLQFCRQNRRQ